MRSAVVSLRSLGLVLGCLVSASMADAGIARAHRPTAPVAAPAQATTDATADSREFAESSSRRVRLILQERARLILAWTHAFGAPLVAAISAPDPAAAQTRGISDGPDPIGWRDDSGEKGETGAGTGDHGRRPASGRSVGGSLPPDATSESWQIERRE